MWGRYNVGTAHPLETAVQCAARRPAIWRYVKIKWKIRKQNSRIVLTKHLRDRGFLRIFFHTQKQRCLDSRQKWIYHWCVIYEVRLYFLREPLPSNLCQILDSGFWGFVSFNRLLHQCEPSAKSSRRQFWGNKIGPYNEHIMYDILLSPTLYILDAVGDDSVKLLKGQKRLSLNVLCRKGQQKSEEIKGRGREW